MQDVKKQRGTSSWWAEKVLGYQVQGWGLFHLIHRERITSSRWTHKTRGEWSTGGFGSCPGGSNEGEHKVTKGEAHSISQRAPDPALRRERQQPHGSNAASTAAPWPLFSHANQSPNQDCCREPPPYVKRQREHMKTWEGKTHQTEEHKFSCC